MTADQAHCDRWYSLRNALEAARWELSRYLGTMNPALRPQVDADNIRLRNNLEELYPVATQSGADGKSAYELDQLRGYMGTLDQWLDSLHSTVPGPQGDVGPVGPASTVPGPKGDTGNSGPMGPQGPAGPTGPKGADSAVPGPKGDTGSTGATGPAGKDATPVQRIRATTDATTGLYTYTFPTPYAAGVIPVILGMEVEASGTDAWNIQCTKISNTGMTVQTRKTTGLTLLSVGVLGALVNGSAVVHIGVVAP